MNRALRMLSTSFVASLLALSGVVALFGQEGTSTSSGALATYTNQAYAFTLQYPKELVPTAGGDTWSMAASANGGSPEGTPVLTIEVFNVSHDSTKPYPYPLFFSAWVSVGVSPDLTGCYEGIEAEPGTSSAKDVTVGGLPFKVGTTSDAGMMKYTNVTSYRIIHNGACFAVEQIDHGSVYTDENTLPGLSAEQLQAYYDEAGVIARSFRFTDAVPPRTMSSP